MIENTPEINAKLAARKEAYDARKEGKRPWKCFNPDCLTTVWEAVRPDFCPNCKHVSHESKPGKSVDPDKIVAKFKNDPVNILVAEKPSVGVVIAHMIKRGML